jgi:adenine-specific DNA-methyltransferase
MANNERTEKDSAQLVWDTRPCHAPNPRDIELQTAEVLMRNWV